MNLTKLAETIDAAALNAKPIKQLSKKNKFSEKEAYEIQALSIKNRYERGEKLIGLKMGFTSKAKMEQMGVHDLIWGRLTDAMLYNDGDKLPLNKFIHPRAEPELCFWIKKDITKKLTLKEAPDYVEAVAPAIEIIDSRYQKFKFSLEDVIADNCSSAAFVFGKWYRPSFDIKDLNISLHINKKLAHEGSSKAILGNPWKSFVDATRLAKKYKEPIKKGMYIMLGAATPAVYLEKGNKVTATVEGMGSVSLKVK